MTQSKPRKTAAKKTAVKKTTGDEVKVKMIQTFDPRMGHDTLVFFSDGTRAEVEEHTEADKSLRDRKFVAPNMVQVHLTGGKIVRFEPVDVDKGTPD